MRRAETRNSFFVKAIVTVMPKTSVLDPQGAATAEAMKHLGFENVGRVRVGKSIEIDLPSGVDETQLHQIARDLLSNPVIEDYRLEIAP
ncbi:MAG TPA: phosphoribosylformylglycinamidine synthase subunit PurS [Terrimicrobiaceae bacterium]